MTIQSSGQIAFSDVDTELQRASSSQISFDDYEVRTFLTKKAVGAQASMTDFYNTAYVSATTTIFNANGVYTVPPHISMTVQVWGGGGGGGGYGDPGSGSYATGNYYGGTGGTSIFAAPTNLIAYGGTGGQTAGTSNAGGLANGTGGTGGAATGGDTNTAGGAGVAGFSGGNGAAAPQGGVATAGYGVYVGNPPGGGGSGFFYSTGGKFPAASGGGGSGGYVSKTYSGANRLTFGSTVAVTVGAAGAASATGGGAGAAGRVIISLSGLAVFSTIGTTSWTVPVGVTQYRMIVVGGAGGGGFVTCPTNAGSMPGGYGGYAESTGALTAGQTLSVTVGAGGTGPARNTGNPGGASSISGGGISVTATGGGGGYFIYGPNVGHAGADGSASGGTLYNGTSQSPPANFTWQPTYASYGKPNAYGDGTQGIVVIEYF